MGLVEQAKGFLRDLFPENEDDWIEEPGDIEEEPVTTTIRKDNIAPIKNFTHGYEVVVFEPTSFNDSLEIAKNLTERKTVVLNLEMLENESSQRIVDFLSGVTFALDGNQQKIGEVFIFTPKNVTISSVQEKSQTISTEGFWNIPHQQ